MTKKVGVLCIKGNTVEFLHLELSKDRKISFSVYRKFEKKFDIKIRYNLK